MEITLKWHSNGICLRFEMICRCFFVAMFMLVFIFSVYFITNVWIRWSKSPMIITLGAIPTPISEFPFPGQLEAQTITLDIFFTWSILKFTLNAFIHFQFTFQFQFGDISQMLKIKQFGTICFVAVTICNMNQGMLSTREIKEIWSADL